MFLSKITHENCVDLPLCREIWIPVFESEVCGNQNVGERPLPIIEEGVSLAEIAGIGLLKHFNSKVWQ